MRIGIFGGTFDPPHLGHLILANEAQSQMHLDRLLWALTGDPPHKRGQSITPLSHRVKMVQLALAGEQEIELSRIEIDRPSPHYAVDTIHLLAGQYPQAELVYLMGGDSLRDLTGWQRPAELVAACHEIGVMRRPGDDIDLSSLIKTLPDITKKVRFVDAPLLEISSREIRQRIAGDRPFRHYLPPVVFQYIQENKLYR
ncbi:MAG: nicotinate (nicotinamide) nucleotide adenylyltransferase [Chloroflexi bacterium]|nr:nicotinate (nicotinamide) nucleotide adenylyltransferase [Chloroflexota bacterium]